MATVLILVLGGVIIWAAWWWFVARNRPAVPPLTIDENDPLMLGAIQRARDSIPQLRALFPDAKGHANVKVPFVTSTGVTEHLWAELLSLEETQMVVRYMTPPVSHQGRLERVHRHPVTDLEDWVITKDPRKYVGGYTMRVMFQKYREMWGYLPPKLKPEEAKYAS